MQAQSEHLDIKDSEIPESTDEGGVPPRERGDRDGPSAPPVLTFTGLKEIGYNVTPCRGKQPTLQNWQRRVASRQDCETWDRSRHNIGIVLGDSGGQVAALDVDVSDSPLADRIEERIRSEVGVTGPTRIGSAPKRAMFVRVAQQTRKRVVDALDEGAPDGKARHKFELLATGQQVIVAGLHPVTQQPYRLNAPMPPVCELKRLTEEDVERVFGIVAEEFGRDGFRVSDSGSCARGPRRKATKQRGRPEKRPTSQCNVFPERKWGKGDMPRVLNALVAISPDVDRDTWLRVLMSLYEGTHGSSEGLQLADAWSSGALAQVAAAKYVGTSDVSDRWNSFTAGGGIGIGTLFYVARENGWSDPYGADDSQAESRDLEGVATGCSRAGTQEPHEWVQPVSPFRSGIDSFKFDPEMFPPLVAAYAQDIGARVGCDENMAALMMIAIAGGLVPDQYRVQVKQHDPGWTEKARMWTLVIADPASKKTPTLNELRSPVHRAIESLSRRNQQEFERYEREDASYQKSLKSRGPDSGRSEAAIEAPSEAPRVPRKRRKLVDDFTIEALAVVQSENPGGVFGIYDEISTLFGRFDAYLKSSGRDRAALLSMRAGERLTVDRKSKHLPLEVENASLGLLGNIQPAKLAELSRKARLTDDGFLQRFLPVFARRASHGQDVAPNLMARRNWEDVVRVLALLEDTEMRPVLRYDEYAQRRMDALRVWLHERLAAYSDAAIQQHLEKLPGVVAQLTVAYWAIEAAGQARTAGELDDDVLTYELPPESIGDHVVRWVEKLCKGIILPSIEAMHELAGVTPISDLSEKIADWILSNDAQKVRPSDVTKNERQYRGDTKPIYDAMARLTDLDWVEPVPTQRGNRILRWEVNPLVHTSFVERAHAAKDRQTAALASIAESAARRRSEER